jgi:general secretion pathway protein C
MLQIHGPSATRSFVVPLVTLCIWAAVAACITYWVLQFPQQQAAHAAAVATENTTKPDLSAHAARALGQQAATASAETVQAASQFKLLGVIAKGSGGGSALIAVDGQAPKAYRVGQTVHEAWVLSSLSARQARLQAAGANMLLDLPSDEKDK